MDFNILLYIDLSSFKTWIAFTMSCFVPIKEYY